MGPRPLGRIGSSADEVDVFDAFHARLDESARRYAAVILGARHREEVADVLQDAWARAWRSWASADPDRREQWFFRIVRNAAIDRHRARRGVVLLDLAEHDVAVGGGFDDAMEWKRALALLDGLPPRLRETLWLRAGQDLSYREIANVLDVPIGTVMSRLSAARRRLSRQLGRAQ
jgi:RNA polymerase sigma-70 factor (ECF subfamily)